MKRNKSNLDLLIGGLDEEVDDGKRVLREGEQLAEALRLGVQRRD